MLMKPAGPDIGTSALVIVDMQHDVVHSDGGFVHLARERSATLVALVLAEPRVEAVDFNARVFDARPWAVVAPSR
jgi:hypothetical protein